MFTALITVLTVLAVAAGIALVVAMALVPLAMRAAN